MRGRHGKSTLASGGWGMQSEHVRQPNPAPRLAPFRQLSYGSQKCDVGWLSGRVEVGDYQKPMVKAAIAHRMAGTSNLNVLGLGRGNAVRARRFSMILTDDGGELALTPSARKLLASRVEKRASAFPSSPTQFITSYRVAISSLTGGRPHGLQGLCWWTAGRT